MMIEVGLVEKLSGSLYWWVELGVPSLHREYAQLNYDIRFKVHQCNLRSLVHLITKLHTHVQTNGHHTLYPKAN